MTAEDAGRWSDDEELVRRLIARDKQAFETFYKQYAPLLLRRLIRMTGDATKAQDLLQQTMIEIIESLHDYKARGALGAWVNRIATFVTIDRFRQEGRKRNLWERWSNQLASISESSAPLPETLMESNELQVLVREQIEQLSPRKRMAILLCDLEGLSLEDAGKQMDVPTGTVSSRLHHGRRELRQCIKNELKRRGLSVEDILHE